MATEDHRPYYDDHVHVQIKHFIDGNQRVERAVQRVLSSVDSAPSRVLEVGCGIGHVAARLSSAWPAAQIVGVDTSPKSIELARRLFASDRVSYEEGMLEESGVQGPFDLVIMMDMLEHVPVAGRASLMSTVGSVLAPDGRVVITVPTPQFLEWLRQNQPDRIQPIDEDITATLLEQIAESLGRGLLLYEQIGVWRRNDYAHAVIGDRAVAPLRPRPAAAPESNSLLHRLMRRARPAGASAADDAKAARRELVISRLGESALPPADAAIGDQGGRSAR